MQVIRRYSLEYQAELARSLLESKGIAAVIQGQHLGITEISVTPSFSIELMVDKSEAARSVEILDGSGLF